MKIIVRSSKIEEEKRRVENIKNRLSFFEEHGYKVSLPDGKIEDVFYEHDYLAGIRTVEHDRAIIELATVRMYNLADKLHITPPYLVTVVITKYGVGGSYDVNSGRIVVMLKPDGSLIKPAAHLVVHEILHLASQQTLVTPFRLTHSQKERLIDLLCRDVFGDLLQNYQMQQVGDVSMDELLVGVPNIDIEQRFIERFGKPQITI